VDKTNIPTVKLFRNDREALFAERPNRFLIIARNGKTTIPCHCPNPGRLIEFFGYRGSDIPGARLILEKRNPAANSKAKTGWTAVGIYYRNGVAPLFSARANKAAEKLILKEIIPGLRESKITEIHSEFTLGDSRFDFLCIDSKGTRHLVEVKACSLVEHGIAMFPDAPSGRALKHLEELASLHGQGYQCHILFVIVHGEPERFIPNLHTDPDLSAALSVYGHAADPWPLSGKKDGPKPASGPVRIHACLLHCDSSGEGFLAKAHIPVDLSHGELAAQDSGNYLVMLEMPQPCDVETGTLGTLHFKAGWYVYAGSARKNLSKRISRHLRKVRKQLHWYRGAAGAASITHSYPARPEGTYIDYITPYAGIIKAYPICSYRNLECDLAGALENLGGTGVPGFGSSDCNCKSHLFYFRDKPLKNPAFIDLLLHFRHVEAFEQ
jgi:sugar fermentation stimulation protein A